MNLNYNLNSDEIERYKRQILLEKDFGFSQEKLKKATVFIAGAGGLGSPASLYLAAAGIGRLIIADYDRLALSNLNRQILHSTSSLGELKAESAQRRLAGLNPEIKVETHTMKIEGDVSAILSDADLIIDCLDNIQTRYTLNDFSIKSGTPIVHGGINGYAGQVSFIAPPETACLRCIFPEPYTGDGPIPVIGATAGIIGTKQALEAVKYLCGSGDLLKNKLLIIDGFTWEIANLTIEKNPSCRACSDS